MYDADGMRASKTVNGVKTTYTYLGGRLAYQTSTDGKELYFFYDSYGKLIHIKYYKNGTLYNYHVTTNSMGDVIGIYNSSGALKVSYEYDAWGNCDVEDTSTTGIGTLNPIRYRGYYFDVETGLYYLQSRYYNPQIGRFLNADGYLTTDVDNPVAYNMFAYCGNNPVMYSDPTGRFLKEIFEWGKAKFDDWKNWARNTFGAGRTTTTTIAEIVTPVISDPSPITVKTGSITTQIISKYGDSSKPISVFANKDARNPIISSSAGININIVDFAFNLSVGLDNIGVSSSLTKGKTTNSFGVRLNLSELKIGFESSTAVQWDNTTETTYTNASISGWAVAAVYILVTTGQYVPSPSYAY